ncbi:MAG: hypothetical protein E6R04_03315 [Spirochaetes bacterium]|nr:MAG: hypothetical protein E6R04_03315 [Spirochaetota bacterium]
MALEDLDPEYIGNVVAETVPVVEGGIARDALALLDILRTDTRSFQQVHLGSVYESPRDLDGSALEWGGPFPFNRDDQLVAVSLIVMARRADLESAATAKLNKLSSDIREHKEAAKQESARKAAMVRRSNMCAEIERLAAMVHDIDETYGES